MSEVEFQLYQLQVQQQQLLQQRLDINLLNAYIHYQQFQNLGTNNGQTVLNPGLIPSFAPHIQPMTPILIGGIVQPQPYFDQPMPSFQTITQIPVGGIQPQANILQLSGQTLPSAISEGFYPGTIPSFAPHIQTGSPIPVSATAQPQPYQPMPPFQPTTPIPVGGIQPQANILQLSGQILTPATSEVPISMWDISQGLSDYSAFTTTTTSPVSAPVSTVLVSNNRSE
jgi:hypothetical protein